jgi:hypothetical protein
MTPEIRRNLGYQRASVSHLIVHQMRIHGYTRKALAAELGISSQAVSKTINGFTHSERVICKLREIGVNEELLFDPRTSKTDAMTA